MKLSGSPDAVSKYHTKEENYYFSQADGVESVIGDGGGDGQSHVQIHGKLAGLIGFKEGQTISEAQFTHLLSGRDAHGKQVAREHKVVGIDLTFSAPKSVSVAALLTIRDAKIVEAHDKAVSETMREIEKHFAGTQKWIDGGNAHVRTDNLAYVTVRDGFNREHDPHLHTHVVVANMTSYGDKIMALDGKQIMARDFNKLWGAMYRAKLAANLNELGYSVSYTKKGELRLDAVSLDVEREFSGRRAQIAAAKAKGARDIEAWRKTRKEKDASVEKKNVLADWRSRAALHPEKTAAENRQEGVLEREAWYREARWSVEAGQEISGQRIDSEPAMWQTAARRATDKTACVTAQALITEYLAELGRAEAWNGLTYAQAERRLQDQVKAGRFLQTEDGRYTTWELTRDDRECVTGNEPKTALALDAAEAQRAVAAFNLARKNEGGRVLSQPQAAAAAGILASRRGKVVVQGDAGAGKTTMMRAIQEIGSTARWELVGIAVQGVAARKLQAESGIKSTTLASYLAQERAAQASQQRAPRLLMLDEASMLGTRDLAQLLRHAQKRGDKVVLVGDRNQIQSVGAGKPFERLVSEAEKAGELLSLNENFRQKDPILKQAVDLARDGRMRESLGVLDKAGKLSEIENAYLRRLKVAQLYGKNTLVLSGTVEGRDALNKMIRDNLFKSGELNHATERSFELVWADEDGVKHSYEREFTVGDRVAFLENEYKLYDVRNGDVGTVTSTGKNALGVRLEDGREVRLEVSSYGALDHGYAMTTYKSQGQTYDKVVVDADTRYAHLQDQRNSYVQITRAREEVRIFTDDREALFDVAGVLSSKQDTLELKASLAHATAMERRVREEALAARARGEAGAKIVQSNAAAKLDAEKAVDAERASSPARVDGKLNVRNQRFLADATEKNHDARAGFMRDIAAALESRQDLSDGEKSWVAEYLNSNEAAKTLERFNDPRQVIAVGLVKSRAMDLEEATKDLSGNQKIAVTLHVRNEEIEKERERKKDHVKEKDIGLDFTL